MSSTRTQSQLCAATISSSFQCQISFWLLFSSWFSPLGASVLSSIIEKSCRFSHSLVLVCFYLSMFDISVNCSIRVNFEVMAMYFKMIARLFVIIFSVKLKGLSDFPTSWILHDIHSIK